MFSFEVSLAGWPETCFPLEPVLWCQPFYYSRFTSSGESRGGGTASFLLLHLVSSLLLLPLFSRCFCCFTTTGSFHALTISKANSRQNQRPISKEPQQKHWPKLPPQYNWNKTWPLGEEKVVHNVTRTVTNLWQIMWESPEVAVVTENSMKTNGWFRCG